MGMYTEICLRVCLKEDTPVGVIEIIRKLVAGESTYNHPDHPFFLTPRNDFMMRCSSFYHIPFATMRLDKSGYGTDYYYLHGRSDLKNYSNEIELFFDWIYPYCEEGMIGYSLYEEDIAPHVYKKIKGKLYRDDKIVSKH